MLLATQNVNGETIPRAISTNAVDKAVGILRGDGRRGAGDHPHHVFGLDWLAVRRIAQPLAALRAAAGRLTRQAAGEV